MTREISRFRAFDSCAGASAVRTSLISGRWFKLPVDVVSRSLDGCNLGMPGSGFAAQGPAGAKAIILHPCASHSALIVGVKCAFLEGFVQLSLAIVEFLPH